MKYSVRTVIIVAASSPYNGMKKIFKIIFTISPERVIYITGLKCPIPFNIIPVRLFNPSAMMPVDSTLSIIMESLYLSV